MMDLVSLGMVNMILRIARKVFGALFTIIALVLAKGAVFLLICALVSPAFLARLDIGPVEVREIMILLVQYSLFSSIAGIPFLAVAVTLWYWEEYRWRWWRLFSS